MLLSLVLHYSALQDSGVAREQPMPGHSKGTLRLQVASYPGPTQLLTGNAEATRRVWGVLPQKILKFLSFLAQSGVTLGHTAP